MSKIRITAEEFQKNVEEIVDNCSENGTVYEISYEGDKFLLIPYDIYKEIAHVGEEM